MTLNRFVYAYLIYDERICLIDSGVAGSSDVIFDYIQKTGRSPQELSTLVFTHAHPDHIGGALSIINKTGCKTAAHVNAKPWIEDINLQYRERPVPNFHGLVEGSVRIDRDLEDRDTIDPGGNRKLDVIHTPGHSRDSISLACEAEGVLYSGDLIPVPGEMPIYEDVTASLGSIRKLKGREGIRTLLSSWDEPRQGGEAYASMDRGIDFIRTLHAVVSKTVERILSSGPQEVTRAVIETLGLPPYAMNPIFIRTVEAHIKIIGKGTL